MPPDFEPVDHDPFTTQPVEYDPFAAESFANPLVDKFIRSAASLPQRAIDNSQHSLDTGTYDPGPTLEAATLPMGTGAISGVPVRAGEAVLGAGPIRAFHGSPHDFDAFSLDKIGTGEGAQAYGHGLYFAENEGVAKGYRDALTQPVQTAGNAHVQNLGGKYHIVDDFGVQAGPFNTKEEALASMSKQQGKIYEVNINADPAHFLDWDKPLSQQSPKIQDSLKQSLGTNWDEFKHAYAGDAVKRGLIAPGSEAGTTAANLSSSGIPGIKYLDQGSRASGDGSRNYVVFNDKLIDIIRKYGLAGISMLPPAAAAAVRRQITPVDHDPFANGS